MEAPNNPDSIGFNCKNLRIDTTETVSPLDKNQFIDNSLQNIIQQSMEIPPKFSHIIE
jgi:hypothetical protein